MAIQKYKPAGMNPRVSDSAGWACDAKMSDSIQMPGFKRSINNPVFYIRTPPLRNSNLALSFALLFSS